MHSSRQVRSYEADWNQLGCHLEPAGTNGAQSWQGEKEKEFGLDKTGELWDHV